MSVPATKIENQNGVNHTPVVGLNVDTPYNRIMSFINEYGQDRTRISYTRYYKMMFEYMCGKSLEQLTYQDIKAINDIKVEGFRNYLKEKYKHTYVNQIIFACKALWDRFREKRIVEYNDFDIKPLMETTNSYGSLTSKEIEDLFAYCLEQKYKPMTIKLYFEFLYTVTCRKSAAQKMTWDDINRELDLETGEMLWVVTFPNDKGKEVKKAIQDEFYERLKENYLQTGETSGKVFNVNNQHYDKVLKGFCQKFGISEKRNICQHSIKGSGLDYVMAVTGDVNTVALAGQHKNVNTAFKRYLNKNRRFSEHPSYYLGKNYSVDMLSELSKEELLKLIQNSGKEIVVKLCLQLEKK